MENKKGTMTLGGRQYVFREEDLEVNELSFYVENPRVFSALNVGSGIIPSQEEIFETMRKLDNVKQLKMQIKSNGGLIEPIFVRDGNYDVLEGNSRLAAYKLLLQEDSKWYKMKCKILPKDISEEDIFNLLGTFHITGKKDWGPYEQASYLYRRMKKSKYSIETIAKNLGIKNPEAKKMVETIEFMINNGDDKNTHYSYYYEYLKATGIKKYRHTSEKIDTRIVECVKSGEISKAEDMRKLDKICKVKANVAQKCVNDFIDDKIDLYESYERVEETGKLANNYQKLKKFRDSIAKESFEEQILCEYNNYKLIKFEIKHINKRLESLNKKIEENEKQNVVG